MYIVKCDCEMCSSCGKSFLYDEASIIRKISDEKFVKCKACGNLHEVYYKDGVV